MSIDLATLAFIQPTLYRSGGGRDVRIDVEPKQIAEVGVIELDVLGALQTRFGVSLSPTERQVVQRMADHAADAETMTMSAFFLNRVGQEIDDAAMRALYASQVWPDAAQINLKGQELSAMLKGVQQGNGDDITAFGEVLCDAFAAAAEPGISIAQAEQGGVQDGMGSHSNSYHSRNAKDLDAEQLQAVARHLLNIQDAGSLAYRYGSLPVMVGGQMLELDMVLFRERQSPQSPRTQGLRKLVMTLKTETLGRVEIVAESVDAVLSVAIGTQSPQATERLAEHAQEVRDLVHRLGWKVDSVNYRLSADTSRAAEHLVRHVVRAGTLDAVV